jgi:predicted nucleotidyltransferase
MPPVEMISVVRELLPAFCRKWSITELALFGSILGSEFRSDSDVDVLVSFSGDVEWGLLDHARMQDELSQIFGRRVDLVTRRAVEHSHNRIRRDAILNTAEVLYAA